MIEVQSLSKRYGELTAVDEVSFTAQPGSIFGLLGPNGAGKSTTIGCISERVAVQSHDVMSDGLAARSVSCRRISRCTRT